MDVFYTAYQIVFISQIKFINYPNQISYQTRYNLYLFPYRLIVSYESNRFVWALFQQRHPLGVRVPAFADDAVQIHPAGHAGAS